MDTDISSIKSRLIACGYADDNEWADRYAELISANEHTERVPKYTQRHHIIPVSYYKSRHLEVDNSTSNLVNLSFKDHMKAHLFLSGCTKGQERYKNLYSVFQMSHFDSVGFIEIQNYDYYQKLYVDAIHAAPSHRKGTKVSESTHAKMRKASKLRVELNGSATRGTIWVTDGCVDKMIKPSDLDNFISKGYRKGRSFRHSAEVKKRIGQHSRERVITDEFRERMREVGRLSSIARDPESYKKQGRVMHEYYKTHPCPFKGRSHTPEAIEKNKQSHIGRKYIHKDGVEKSVRPAEVEQYLSQGWKLGHAAWRGNQYTKLTSKEEECK